MLDVGLNGVVCNNLVFNSIEKELKELTDKRMFAIVEAIKKGFSIEIIYNLSSVDPWFLYKIKNIVELEQKLKNFKLEKIPFSLLKEAKQKGFSDQQIAIITKSSEKEVRKYRKNLCILPYVKQIDTLAAEYPAKTNYLYLTYNGCENDLEFKDKNQVVVLGGGAYRIALWDDKDSKVRLEAAEVLAGMGPMAVDPLKNTLKNKIRTSDGEPPLF